jgi:hypothetical protein
MYFYVDESGDPNILGRKGRNLIEQGLASRAFIVGYVETRDPKKITTALAALRNGIASDEYLRGIPSISSTLQLFHANKDCAEVKERVFRLLREADFSAYAVVARKSEALFRKKFRFHTGRLYEYLVAKLFENRLHLYANIDVYFATMGNIVRERKMRRALDEAMIGFKKKWGKHTAGNIRIFVQTPSQIPMLQVVDYALWAVGRVFEREDYRYYNFIREKIALVQDIFDFDRYPNTFYTPKNPLQKMKSSQEARSLSERKA